MVIAQRHCRRTLQLILSTKIAGSTLGVDSQETKDKLIARFSSLGDLSETLVVMNVKKKQAKKKDVVQIRTDYVNSKEEKLPYFLTDLSITKRGKDYDKPM